MRNTFKALIIDDSKAVCEFLRKLLPGPDFIVVGEAHEGKAALQMVKELRPDIVLLDIVLPQISGVVIFKEIARIAPHALVIFVTDKATPDIIRKIMSINGRYFLVKPVKGDVLAYTIKKALAKTSLEALQQRTNVDYPNLLEENRDAYATYMALMDRNDLLSRAQEALKTYEDEQVEVFKETAERRDRLAQVLEKYTARKAAVQAEVENLAYIVENISENNRRLEQDRAARVDEIKHYIDRRVAHEKNIEEKINQFNAHEKNIEFARGNVNKAAVRLRDKVKTKETLEPELERANSVLAQATDEAEKKLLAFNDHDRKVKDVAALYGKLDEALEQLNKTLEAKTKMAIATSEHLVELGKRRKIQQPETEKVTKSFEQGKARVIDFLAKIPGLTDNERSLAGGVEAFFTLDERVTLPPTVLPKLGELAAQLKLVYGQWKDVIERDRRIAGQLEQLNQASQTLTLEIDQLRAKQQDFVRKQDGLKVLNKNLEDSIKSVNSEYRAALERKEATKIEIVKLRQRMQPLDQEIDKCKAELDLTETTLRTFLIKKEQFEKELKELDEEFEKINNAIEKLSTANAQTIERIAKNAAELQGAFQKLKEKDEEQRRLAEDIVDATAKVSDVDTACDVAENRVLVCRVGAEQLKEQVSKVQRILVEKYQRSLAIMITDLKGSTKYYETFGDIAGRKWIKTHNELLYPIVEPKGRIFKTKGDSIFAYFSSPQDIIDTAIRMQERLREYNAGLSANSEREQIRVRIFLHFGKGIVEDVSGKPEVYGDVVYHAIKIEENGGDQADIIVVSQDIFDAVLDESGVIFSSFSTVEILPNLPPMELFELRWREMLEEAREQPTSAAG